MEETYRLRSYVAGPKWVGLKEFLYEVALAHDVEYRTIEHDRGWFRETIWYVLEGNKQSVKNAQSYIDEKLCAHNEL